MKKVKYNLQVENSGWFKKGKAPWNKGKKDEYQVDIKSNGCIDTHGYKVFYNKGAEIKEHRTIMEEEIGRKLAPKEIIHHKNGIRNDNRIENLELTNRSNHASLHHQLRRHEK